MLPASLYRHVSFQTHSNTVEGTRLGTDACELKINFSTQYSESVFLFALNPDQFEMIVHGEEKKYVLQKENDNIYVSEISDNGELPDTLFVLPIQELMETLKRMFQEADSDHRTLSPALIKSMKCHFWKTRQAALKQRSMQLYFPVERYNTETLSEDLKAFLQTGQLPETNVKKGLLLWECHQLMVGSDANYSSSYLDLPYNYLQCIINDMKHLDFTLVDFKPGLDADSKTFQGICNFLKRRFDGNAISFKGVHGIGWDYSSSITSLLKHNPNLTSISFTKCVSDQLPTLAKAISNNDTLIELRFEECGINRGDAHILANALKKNSTLKVLNLKNNNITYAGAIAIMSNNTINSLNFEGNKYCSPLSVQKGILAALLKNTTLTSFHIDWVTAEMRDQCNRHLIGNHIKQNYYNSYYNCQQVSCTDITADVPTDVFRLICGWIWALDQTHNF